jgi:hypothetical protein
LDVLLDPGGERSCSSFELTDGCSRHLPQRQLHDVALEIAVQRRLKGRERHLVDAQRPCQRMLGGSRDRV